MDYKFISFYNRCTSVNPCWEVYGHKSHGNNDLLQSFNSRILAMDYAHSIGLPVIQGSGDYLWTLFGAG